MDRTVIYSFREMKRRIKPFAKKYGVKKVYLFGSYAKGHANKDSDVDLFIEKGKIRTLLELSGFKTDMEKALSKKVDVLTSTGIDDEFVHLIENEMQLIYE
ncbi:MAG: nucleotidyltransferase domain-containing protein [Bacteroidales bacterium]|jgi:predicted nucleotidyltransferase|nr:nucleotidyltransferase domain-containing protein [Bacteroidales bacterium]